MTVDFGPRPSDLPDGVPWPGGYPVQVATPVRSAAEIAAEFANIESIADAEAFRAALEAEVR